jgi:membrane protease subunit HflK
MMVMDKHDIPKERPSETEAKAAEDRLEESKKTNRESWTQRFKAILAAMITLVFTLAKKIKTAFTHIFKDDEDIRVIDDIKGAFRHIPLKTRGVAILLAGFLFAVYLISGVYTVKPGEEAVSTIFGKQIRQSINEGLHYHLPWPFETIEKVNVSEIRRVDVGVTQTQTPLLFPKKSLADAQIESGSQGGHGGHGNFKKASETVGTPSVSSKNQFFTGDENILETRMTIQYQIKDASDYLFRTDAPDSLVPSAVQAAVTEFFGQMPVEDLLTVAKSQIQKRIAQKAQNLLDDYGAGLYIVNVNLQEVNPPKEVAEAFRDVSSAKEEREEKINKAQGYWNTVVPEARGNAHKLISDAEGYREESINQANGDADKFSSMLNEYRRAKNVTEYRLYLETIEKILAKAKKFVVDSKKERVNLKFVK